MKQLDNPRFTLFMEQQERFSEALQEYDPNAWFPPLPGKPTRDPPHNWLILFVPSSWGRWDGCKYGVHFDFMYAPKRGTRPERIRLPIGVESPLKQPFRRRFKESVIDRVNREGIDRSGFTLEAKDRGKLLEVDPIPFGNESWRITLNRYIDLQPVVKLVSQVLREYQSLEAFEVPIFS